MGRGKIKKGWRKKKDEIYEKICMETQQRESCEIKLDFEKIFFMLKNFRYFRDLARFKLELRNA